MRRRAHRTDGNCHAISACSGSGCSGLPFQSISIANVGFVAGVAIGVVIITIACCLTCCWWQGALCFKACPRTRPAPISNMPAQNGQQFSGGQALPVSQAFKAAV